MVYRVQLKLESFGENLDKYFIKTKAKFMTQLACSTIINEEKENYKKRIKPILYLVH